jgi:hypothetical protein
VLPGPSRTFSEGPYSAGVEGPEEQLRTWLVGRSDYRVITVICIEEHTAPPERIIDALAERHLTRHGGLGDACYDQPHNLATASELIWGDYFLLEALLALTGVIKPGTL